MAFNKQFSTYEEALEYEKIKLIDIIDNYDIKNYIIDNNITLITVRDVKLKIKEIKKVKRHIDIHYECFKGFKYYYYNQNILSADFKYKFDKFRHSLQFYQNKKGILDDKFKTGINLKKRLLSFYMRKQSYLYNFKDKDIVYAYKIDINTQDYFNLLAFKKTLEYKNYEGIEKELSLLLNKKEEEFKLLIKVKNYYKKKKQLFFIEKKLKVIEEENKLKDIVPF